MAFELTGLLSIGLRVYFEGLLGLGLRVYSEVKGPLGLEGRLGLGLRVSFGFSFCCWKLHG